MYCDVLERINFKIFTDYSNEQAKYITLDCPAAF